jgi:hypothetical protein
MYRQQAEHAELTFFPVTSVDFQRTTWRYIPEDRTLHNHRCENLSSYKYRMLIIKDFELIQIQKRKWVFEMFGPSI